MFVIYVEVIIYLLLYNLHDCTFNGFPKKIVQGKLTILSTKMAHSHNYGSTLVFKFYTIKGTKRYIKNMLLALPKKIMFKAKGPFWTQK